MEASSRIGANWKIIVEASVFSNGSSVSDGILSVLDALNDTESELGLFQDEDFLKLELVRYF